MPSDAFKTLMGDEPQTVEELAGSLSDAEFAQWAEREVWRGDAAIVEVRRAAPTLTAEEQWEAEMRLLGLAPPRVEDMSAEQFEAELLSLGIDAPRSLQTPEIWEGDE